MSATHIFENLLEHYGALAVGVTVFFDSVGLPSPGESAIIAGSLAASMGKMNIWTIALMAFIGAVIGDNLGYLIGRKYGTAFILKYGAKVGITQEKYDKVTDIALRYGPLMVVVARFVMLLRQLNGLVAGSSGMHWLKFSTANAIGAALWVGFWTTAAYKLGYDHKLVPDLWHLLSRAAFVVVPALIVFLILRYRR